VSEFSGGFWRACMGTRRCGRATRLVSLTVCSPLARRVACPLCVRHKKIYTRGCARVKGDKAF
jgi:hypothetical protein